jgi:hypothetical protein
MQYVHVRQMQEIGNSFIKGNENVMLTVRGQERTMKWNLKHSCEYRIY